MAPVSGYDGFISYSHQHDAVLGPALKISLERFAKPWYKMRELRIFLDTADLGANPGLWPSIVDALGSSTWFILLASPDAAESRWVNREIQWWVENAPLERLLVVATSPGLAWDDRAQDWAVSILAVRERDTAIAERDRHCRARRRRRRPASRPTSPAWPGS